MDKNIYVKFSNERAAKFNICTEIRENAQGKRYVIKRPYTDDASSHVNNIIKWHNKLDYIYAGTGIHMNKCKVHEDGVQFEFINGEKLEEKLDILCQNQEYLQMVEIIKHYFTSILSCKDKKIFHPTEEFAKVFGNVTVPAGLLCSEVTNIDMVFGNAIEHDGLQIIDYEWTFDFPIPINFVLYRALFFYMEKAECSKLKKLNLYEIFDISEEEKTAYKAMEYNFGRYVIHGYVPVRDIHHRINNKVVYPQDIMKLAEHEQNKNKIQIFLDYGEGFSEENSYFIDATTREEEKKQIKITISEKVKKVRIDPAMQKCIVHLHSVFLEKNADISIDYDVNGTRLGQDIIVFLTEDPQIVINKMMGNADVLQLEFSVYIGSESTLKEVMSMIKKQTALESETDRLHAKIILLSKENEALLNNTGKLEEKDQALSSVHHQLSILEDEKNNAMLQYAALLNSRSVKLTRPMRALGNVLKRNSFIMSCIRYIRYLKSSGLRETTQQFKMSLIRKRYPAAAQKLAVWNDVGNIYREKLRHHSGKTKISILVPLYNTPEIFLREMIESVLMQVYENWELCLADGSDDSYVQVKNICKKYARKDRRIIYKKLETNQGISGNTNECIKMATGSYVALFDHDDFLHPNALLQNAKVIEANGADYLYTDEATFQNELNQIITYHFKPDFAPDNLRANNYICHFSVFSKALLDITGGYRTEYDGSQDHDLILRLTENAKKIVHIPQVLYFWRSHPGSVAEDINAKVYAIDAGKNSVLASMKRQGLKGTVESSRAFPTIFRIRYELVARDCVSIIIPNCDHVEDLRRCISSIQRLSTYDNYEIIVVENNSKEQETFQYYEELKSSFNITLMEWNKPFNYSAINNEAVKVARGKYLLFLNNDVEVISPDWIEELLMFGQRPDVGAVGAKLFYPDDTIQHAGIILGLGAHRVAGHGHYKCDKDNLGYMGRLFYAQNVSAVTAACMLVRKQTFIEVGGFDEEYTVAYNDVDLCVKILTAGYLNVFNPYAELYHYESATRGDEDTIEKQERFQQEVDLFKTKWKTILETGDPYFNINFSLDSSSFERKTQ